MNLRRCAIRILQWTLGWVVLIQSCGLALGPGPIHNFARSGLPHWIRPVLAWPEIAGAVLFLIPATCVFGGWVLLVIFGLAVLVHVLHGQYNVGMLLVYGAATWAVLADRGGRSADAPPA